MTGGEKKLKCLHANIDECSDEAPRGLRVFFDNSSIYKQTDGNYRNHLITEFHRNRITF